MILKEDKHTKHSHQYINTHTHTFFFLSFSRGAFAAHGGSQARGRIGDVAAGLRQSHSNAGSKPSVQPTPQLTAMPDP